MKTYQLDSFDPQRFRPANQQGEIAIEFHEFFFDARRKKGMAQVTITEDNLTQHLWLAIVWGKSHWHIRPGRGCEILPTVGLQRALDLAHTAAAESTAHRPHA